MFEELSKLVSCQQASGHHDQLLARVDRRTRPDHGVSLTWWFKKQPSRSGKIHSFVVDLMVGFPFGYGSKSCTQNWRLGLWEQQLKFV